MLNEKKLGGILCELSLDAGKVKHAVIGIGLNVNQPSFPAEIRELATSLFVETGKEWSRSELVSAVLRQLNAEYREMQASPEDAIRACIPRFEARSSYARGKRVKVAESDGFEGTTDGLDAHGFLRVRRGAEVRTVISGGVRPA
jgi:BirA family biotin operon repressor/biotin-[acetyl-CoA-carboxylase] ligase